ncbi:hypothetical protein LCGC14_1322640 [marine sediment metagenome]|uniref:Gfo/Idh/MocA-like oxidoreductase N-terminal domain-containing protein n=1 Tax=marine sediment metagenome TaxID=412755 RepID=A0A0F9L4I2_9ZZZZ
MKRFALLGAAGFIAPRHMRAIRDVGGDLVAICDPSDSVGVIDQYFPNCEYFREIGSLDRHLEKLRREGSGIDYLSICTPNYLHDAHCRMALRLDADAICEKPVVIEPHNIDALRAIEDETTRCVRPILQLRSSTALYDLRDQIQRACLNTGERVSVVVQYYTFRGQWYGRSWKGQTAKSGGLLYNIGIHVLDLLGWLLGPFDSCSGALDLEQRRSTHAHLKLVFARGDADVTLSLDPTIGSDARYRRIDVSGGGITWSREVSDFGDLHTAAYRAILDGDGLTLEDARPAIELAHFLRV